MIPESIKIDDNGDFEVIYTYWYDGEEMEKELLFTFEEIEEAYFLAKSKRDRVRYDTNEECTFNG